MSDGNDILSKGWNKNRRIGMNIVTFAMVFAMMLVTLGGLGCIGGDDGGADANTNDGGSDGSSPNLANQEDDDDIFRTSTNKMTFEELDMMDSTPIVFTLDNIPEAIRLGRSELYIEDISFANGILKFTAVNDFQYPVIFHRQDIRINVVGGGQLYRSTILKNSESKIPAHSKVDITVKMADMEWYDRAGEERPIAKTMSIRAH